MRAGPAQAGGRQDGRAACSLRCQAPPSGPAAAGPSVCAPWKFSAAPSAVMAYAFVRLANTPTSLLPSNWQRDAMAAGGGGGGGGAGRVAAAGHAGAGSASCDGLLAGCLVLFKRQGLRKGEGKTTSISRKEKGPGWRRQQAAAAAGCPGRVQPFGIYAARPPRSAVSSGASAALRRRHACARVASLPVGVPLSGLRAWKIPG